MSADVEETNARQAAVDSAALALARQRLSATFGQTPPWSHGGNQALLQALANGSTKLVRATFPLGTLPEGTPKTLRAARIGTAATGKGWKLTSVWPAPADAGVPGRSFFAILSGGDAGEGERVIVWAPIGSTQSGALIPAQATVISENKYWCYVETKPGTFVRAEIDTGRPFENGYFVTDGVKVGDKVVVKAAAQLLAQESNSGAEAD
jgi:multidrug efflux pump subunit AcrA (membrane-fusion protein)